MKKEPSQDIYFYIIGWCAVALISIYFILRNVFHFDIIDYTNGCTFNKWTGFYCPGCGGTRAVFALIRGNVFKSLYLHPFVPYVAVIGGWFMISQTIERLSRGKIKIALHFRMIYVWIALALILFNVIWKNALLLFTGIPPM